MYNGNTHIVAAGTLYRPIRGNMIETYIGIRVGSDISLAIFYKKFTRFH